jgi:hypothetical protein
LLQGEDNISVVLQLCCSFVAALTCVNCAEQATHCAHIDARLVNLLICQGGDNKEPLCALCGSVPLIASCIAPRAAAVQVMGFRLQRMLLPGNGCGARGRRRAVLCVSSSLQHLQHSLSSLSSSLSMPSSVCLRCLLPHPPPHHCYEALGHTAMSPQDTLL